jgi:hypothetical protein
MLFVFVFVCFCVCVCACVCVCVRACVCLLFVFVCVSAPRFPRRRCISPTSVSSHVCLRSSTHARLRVTPSYKRFSGGLFCCWWCA